MVLLCVAVWLCSCGWEYVTTDLHLRAVSHRHPTGEEPMTRQADQWR